MLKMFYSSIALGACLLCGSLTPAAAATATAASPLTISLMETGGAPFNSEGIELVLQADEPVAEVSLVANAKQFRVVKQATAALPPLVKGENRVKVLWTELGPAGDVVQPFVPQNFYEFVIDVPASSRSRVSVVKWSYMISKAPAAQPVWTQIKPRSWQPDAEGWRQGIPEDGFGRFGWLQSSGLLVGALRTDGFEVTAVDEGGKKVSGAWKMSFGQATYCAWQRTEADWVSVKHQLRYDFSTELKNELAAKAPELLKETRFPNVIRGSILAPGILVETADKEMAFEPEAVLGAPAAKLNPRFILPGAGGTAVALEAGKEFSGSDLSEGWFIAIWPGRESIPVLFVLQNKPKLVSAKESKLTLQFPDRAGYVGISYPAGYRFAKDGTAGVLADRARRLAAILRAYPIGCAQEFRTVGNAGDELEIRDTFRYLSWESAWGEKGRSVAPVSPMLVFGQERGYPVKLPTDLATGLDWPTKYGPYRFREGNQVSYRLPVPPMGTRVYLRPAGANEFAEHLSREIMKVVSARAESTKWMQTDCLQGWWMWAPSSLAFPVLSEEQKAAFLKGWKVSLERAMGPHSFYLRHEPFSGSVYPVSFAWVERNTQTVGDINSGVGALVYAVWAYARCSGDWEFVEKHWSVLRGVMEYALVQHDWCQMQMGAREYSGSSAIDMDGIAYEGVVAYAAMAEALGKKDEAAMGDLLRARIGASTVIRWLGMHWIVPEFKREDWNSVGVGFSEVTGFDTLHSRHGGPDHAASELALSLSWVGQYPELYQLHLWGLGSDFWKWFEADYVEKKVDDWRAKHKGNRNNHPANITAHLYLRQLLGTPTAEVKGELEKQPPFGLRPLEAVAQENSPFYGQWLGIDFPVTLVSWGRAALKSAEFDAAQNKATLVFQCSTPVELELELKKAARTLSINSKSPDGKRLGTGLQRLALPAGNNRVEILF